MTADKTIFSVDFYEKQWRNENAEIILELLFNVLPKINSAVDFGCGLGTWLATIKKMGGGQTVIKGYDGDWVDKTALKIPQECFEAVDLNDEIQVERKYDLALSLEVAEHLHEKSAKRFVGTLTRASDIVLFSAAIPFQGGRDHINLQWQDYWSALFAGFNYKCIDFRHLIWDDARIKSWFKQNMLLYIEADALANMNLPESFCRKTGKQLNIVHPEIYIGRAKNSIYENRLLRLYKMCAKMTVIKIVGENRINRIKALLKK